MSFLQPVLDQCGDALYEYDTCFEKGPSSAKYLRGTYLCSDAFRRVAVLLTRFLLMDAMILLVRICSSLQVLGLQLLSRQIGGNVNGKQTRQYASLAAMFLSASMECLAEQERCRPRSIVFA